eukprot:1229060-Pleurochrysis_carterae.AAC.2
MAFDHALSCERDLNRNFIAHVRTRAHTAQIAKQPARANALLNASSTSSSRLLASVERRAKSRRGLRANRISLLESAPPFLGLTNCSLSFAPRRASCGACSCFITVRFVAKAAFGVAPL